MGLLLDLLEGNILLNNLKLYGCPGSTTKLLQSRSCSSIGGLKVANHVKSSTQLKAHYSNDGESEAFPYIQTLRKFPREKLLEKVVMVRFDYAILLGEKLDRSFQTVSNAVFTIKHLHESGAKIILVSDWRKKQNSKLLDAKSVAGILSSVLQHRVISVQCISSDVSLEMDVLKKADIFLLENLSDFKEEVANCSKFAELLSSGVDIFINDCFSLSHKILASTVGITRFCSACVAGFHFEDNMLQLKKATKTNKRPYVAIIGGGNLHDKATAMHFLASECDGLVFVGMMSFQIMHALGFSVPSNLVEPGAQKAALDIVQFAQQRNIPILHPTDFWCTSNHFPKQMEIVPAHGFMDGWLPVDLGPRSLDEVNSFIMKCKKILWIGPVKFKSSSHFTNGALKLAQMLDELSQRNCDVTVVGNLACKTMMMKSNPASVYDMVENASVVWEFFKGRKLPGIIALDRAYPFEIDWSAVYLNPAQPLVVDIGSGNGLFLLGMAGRRKDLNFLGLEINGKLVSRCLDSVHQSGIHNGYFIATNATSTFSSIISSYPGELVLVSIQVENTIFCIASVCVNFSFYKEHSYGKKLLNNLGDMFYLFWEKTKNTMSKKIFSTNIATVTVILKYKDAPSAQNSLFCEGQEIVIHSVEPSLCICGKVVSKTYDVKSQRNNRILYFHHI